MLEVLVSAIRKHIHTQNTYRSGGKLPIFVNDRIVYIENPKESEKTKHKTLRINYSLAGLQDAR